MYAVYCHKNKITRKMYIGITSQEPSKRWGSCGCNYKSSAHFYSAIKKYGWDNFEHKVLFSDLTKEEACKTEQDLIAKYKTTDPAHGYNIAPGGETGNMSDATKRKISAALAGNRNGAGITCSDEKREKIRIAQAGKTLSKEHRAKLSAAAKRRHTKCSDEKKKTLSNNYPNKKKVYCAELDTVYNSVQECSRALGIPATNISKLCRGRGNTLKGYHLTYYNDTIKA